MTTLEKAIKTFSRNIDSYEKWFDEHPAIVQSEVEAIRQLLPEGESHGIEIGLGTGRIAQALGIKEGIEPCREMRELAAGRGIEVMDARAELIPFKDLHFDFVLITTSIHYIEDIPKALEEANRVLKRHAEIIIGMIAPESAFGKIYQEKRKQQSFYQHATFYKVPTIIQALRNANFKNIKIFQTLFGEPDTILEVQQMKEGMNNGSFILIKGEKK
jgi:ubiquinone/menaquinone biosynthesis C-methylase UbiE